MAVCQLLWRYYAFAWHAHLLAGVDIRPGTSGPCWNSIYTADLCCGSKDDLDSGCWDGVEHTYDKCCDTESIMVAEKTKRRWNALFDVDSSDLTGCMGSDAGKSVKSLDSVLHPFVMRSPQKHHRTEISVERRLRWRMGEVERPSRCVTKTDDLSTQLFDQLRRAGVAMAGWVVNLGAGGWGDPIHHLVAERNSSGILGIFIDPLGPPQQRGYGPGVRFITAAAEPGNLQELFESGGLQFPSSTSTSAHVDFLKIDTDSCDCVLAEAALKLLRPKVLWLEVNLSVPPPFRFVRQWHPDWFESWIKGLRSGRVLATLGCSLSAAVALMREQGYSLFGFDGTDAVFVDVSLADIVGGAGIDEFRCYSELFGQYHIYVPPEWVREWMEVVPHEALHRIWCNFTVHDRLVGIGHMPFSLWL